MLSFRKRFAGLAAVLALATVGHGATAQTGECEYTVTNSWSSGFTGAIRITNTGSSPINGWDVSWQYSTNSVTSVWNANLSGSNPYSATGLGWNSTIQPGQSIEFGFQGVTNGSAVETPAVTGGVCDGGSPASSSSSSFTSSSSIPSSSLSSSSSTSGGSGEACNWYGTVYPLCVTTTNGWGWEDNQSCISRSTCESQPDPFGVVGGGSPGSSSSSSSSSSSFLSSSSFSSSSTPNGGGLYSQADFPIGVAVNGNGENRSFLSLPEQQEVIRNEFSEITAGNIMKMSYLHPSENSYTFTNADALVDWAAANGVGVHGHTLIWHSDYQVPNWMKNYSGDFGAMLNEHVSTVADHFAGRVASWDVVNEAIDENQSHCWRNSVFYQQLGADFVADAFRAADAADPNADLYYNDYDTEGGNANKLQCLLQLVDDLQAQDVPIDGVGFQMHVQIDWPSTSNIASAFQAIVDRGLKVKITEIDVPLNNPYASTPFPQYTSFTDEAAQRQKERYKSIVQTYLDVVPAHLRGGITVWGIWDGESWLLDFEERQGSDDWPLLFTGPADGPYERKPAYYGVSEALTGQ